MKYLNASLTSAVLLSLIAILILMTGCGSLLKNSEATRLAAEKTINYKYKQSISELEKVINNRLMNAQLILTGTVGSARKTNTIKSPLERRMNLHKLRYKKLFTPISHTKDRYKAYNLIEKSKKNLVFISKRISQPSDKSFAFYTITDHGKYRTINIKRIEEIAIMTTSKSSVRMSINGFGLNYKDFFDIDKSLKKAYIDEQEQFIVLSQIDSKASKALYEEARKSVEGSDYEMPGN